MSTSHEDAGAESDGQANQAELFVRFTTLPADRDDRAWIDLAEVLAKIAPGPELAVLLARLEQCSPHVFFLVEMAAAYHRLSAWSHSRLADLGARLAERPAYDIGVEASSSPVSRDLAGDELAIRLGLSRRSGRHLVRDGHAFTRGFQPTGEALAAGHIDGTKARLIVTHLEQFDGLVANAVQEEVLPLAAHATPSELVRHIQKALVAVAPDEAARRHRRARGGRRVDHPRPLPDGMASIYAVLPAVDALTVDLVLEGAARTAKANGDGRTVDQLRADALALLAHTAQSAGAVGITPELFTGNGAPSIGPLEPGACEAVAPGAGPPSTNQPKASARGALVPRTARPQSGPGTAGLPQVNSPIAGLPEGTPPTRAAKRAAPPMRIGKIGGLPPQIRVTVPLSVLLPQELLDEVLAKRHNDPPSKGTAVSTVGKSPPQGQSASDSQKCCDEGPCCLKGGPCCLELNPYALGAPPAEVATLHGYGAISPDVARALALGGTWQRLLVDPKSGAVLDIGRRRYRPPAELAAFVRERDRTCVRPGCSSPAQSCDLDHTVPWNQGGTTTATNLAALCATDHAIKSLGAFRLRHRAEAGYEWTTPSGHRYLRDAEGVVHALERVPRPRPGQEQHNGQPVPAAFPDQPPF